MKSERRAAACMSGKRRVWLISVLAHCSSSSILKEPAAWQCVRMEAFCLGAEKEGKFWPNVARVGAGEASGEMVAWRCQGANTSSSDGVGERVGVGDGTGEG